MAGGVEMDVYTDNRILVYVNVDTDGEITESEIGYRIIPSKQYDHFFITHDESILIDAKGFKVENGELVRK